MYFSANTSCKKKMNRPYIICHMISSIDGRIDCAMTAKLNDVAQYYEALSKLNTPTTVSGRVTAQLELADPGSFISSTNEIFNKEGFSKKVNAEGYDIVVDTKGSLLWDNRSEDKPLIIITSEQVKKDYLSYLDERNISWIACGQEKIDLVKASQILADEFNIQRMSVVGGGHINAGFLEAGILDEVSLLIGAGIDGRAGMAAVFDGLSMDRELTSLKLESVKQYGDDCVWLRYKVK